MNTKQNGPAEKEEARRGRRLFVDLSMDWLFGLKTSHGSQLSKATT